MGLPLCLNAIFMGIPWCLHGTYENATSIGLHIGVPRNNTSVATGLPWDFHMRVPCESHGNFVVQIGVTVLPWNFHVAFIGFRLELQAHTGVPRDLCTGLLSDFHGAFMRFPSRFHTNYTRLRWCPHVTCMGLPRCFRGNSKLPWESHVTSMRLHVILAYPWDLHRKLMRVPWESPWESHETSVGPLR